jgi:Rieske Fe-S protein
MKRKEFLKTACGAYGVGLLAGILLSEESCTPKAGKAVSKYVPEAGKVSIPTSAMGENNIQIFQVKGMEDVGLVKKADGTYLAFEMKCTHQGATLKTRDGKFVCPAHGSIFSNQGAVEKGPAKTALKQYKTLVNGSNIEVYV